MAQGATRTPRITQASESPLAQSRAPVLAVHQGAEPRVPLVLSSPHSGRDYPAAFLAQSSLDLAALRRSEDAFVAELFAAGPGLGIPLLEALFPRAYLDPNREPWELDPAMFADHLPAHINTRSLRVAGGLGTIARIVGDGAEIYRDKLSFAEAETRIATFYAPYHDALERLVDATSARFGAVLLIDCHSMPSLATGDGGRRPDVVLGDRFGMACGREIVDAAASILRDLGLNVVRNEPYAGGFITHHYGRPALGRHALQIELNRALYMDEVRIERGPGFAGLRERMARFLARLIASEPVARLAGTPGA